MGNLHVPVNADKRCFVKVRLQVVYKRRSKLKAQVDPGSFVNYCDKFVIDENVGATWETGAWGACSESCNGGIKTR